MSERHIDFADLSDLYDGLISTEEEKEKILLHIDKCEACRKEYDSLRATVKLLKDMNNAEIRFLNLSPRVMNRIRMKRNIGLAKRYMPLFAAAVIVFAVGLNILAPEKGADRAISLDQSADLRNQIAEKASSLHDKKTVTPQEAGDLLKIINRHDATVVKNNDMFVEGEVSYESFSRLRRELGFRKVSYAYIAQTEPRAETRRGAYSMSMESPAKRSDISEISLKEKSFADEEISVSSEPMTIAQNKKPRVRFRVYK